MSSADDLKDKGNHFLQQGKYDDAIECYSSAIELDRKNHVLYSNRSAAYAKVGQYDDALKDAEMCTSLNPTWAKGFSRKGAALEFLRKYEEAEEAYLKAIDLEPSNESFKESAMTARSRIAMSNLKIRVATHPKLKEYLKNPQYVQNLDLLVQNPSMLSILMKDPKIMETIQELFTVKDEMDVDETRETSPPPKPNKTETPKNQQSELSDSEKTAIAEKELGNIAYKKSDFSTAIAHYEKAYKLNPSDITFLTNKSAVYFQMGDYESSIKTCEEAVERGREIRSDFKLIAKAFARIGHCYEKMEDLPNAKKFYDKSLSEHRDANIIKKSQVLDKKLKEAERKAYINPELADEEKQKGNAAFSSGRFPDAVKHYTEAIKRNPDDPKLYSNRAACYSKLMEFACALKDCETCISLDPTFIKGYLRKASCLLLMKDVSQARNAYRKVLEMDPTCSEAREGLVQCMQTAPDEESARQRAANDPEIQQILCDPAMRMILNQMGDDPSALQEHLKNPEIAEKLMKLVDAGIVQLRRVAPTVSNIED